VRDIRRATRWHFSPDDNIRIALDGLRGEDSFPPLYCSWNPMLSLLRSPDFLRLWATGGANNTTRWLDILTVGIVGYQITRSALWVSLLLFLRLFPMFLLGALIGVIGERTDRRRLLMVSSAALGATYFILGVLAHTDQLGVFHIAFGCLMAGVFWAIEIPARRTMLMEVTGPNKIGPAMGIEITTQNLTRMLGPLLGGVLLEGLGIVGAYWLGALLSFLSVLLLHRLSVGDNVALPPVINGLLIDLRDGFRYARSDPLIMSVLFCTISVNLFGFSYVTLVPVIGATDLKLSALAIGLLMSAEGAGAFIAAIGITFLGQPRHFRSIFLVGSVLFLAGILAFSIADSFTLALTALLTGGVGIAGFSSMQSTLILSQAPRELRSRVMGVLTVCIGSSPAGVLGLGLLASAFGFRTSITIFGILGLLCIAFAPWYWAELRASNDSTSDRAD
jgi:predicted MFS family arabinose efflux permease